MKRNKLLAFAVFLLAALMPLCGISAAALDSSDAVDEVNSLIGGIAAFCVSKSGVGGVQQWLDGELTENAGIGSAEFFVMSLSQSGEKYDYTAYAAALEGYVGAGKVTGAVNSQRCALALTAVGRDSDYVKHTVQTAAGGQGIMSWIFGLNLLNNLGDEYSADRLAAVDTLLSLRLADGGWALTGENSDTDVTAMTMQSLSPFYESDEHVKTALDGAADLLGGRQLEGGDYSGFGSPNPESTAQVLTALSSMGIDCVKDARFIKNGNTLIDGLKKYLLPGGGFCHTLGGEYSATATVQSFYSLISYRRMAEGKGPFYVFDRLVSTPSASSAAQAAEQVFKPDYRFWVCLGIVGAAAVCCVILAIKKKNGKNYLAVLLAAGLLIAATVVFEIKRPSDYYGVSSAPDEPIGSVTLTIRCDTALGKIDNEFLPADGVVLATGYYEIAEGDTVYDLLVSAARQHSLHLESSGASAGLAYIKGINHLYELDCGELSGWIFTVNGKSPSVGCGSYELSDGDEVQWLYTCRLGEDLGLERI